MMKTTTTVYWTTLPWEQGPLTAASTDTGLCYVGLPNETLADAERWLTARLKRIAMVQSESQLAPVQYEMQSYLRGDFRTAFSAPLHICGTPFQKLVWEAVTAIPYGETRSYADIAAAIGRPAAVRAVGAAIGANPLPIVIPCHRVIGTSGSLTGYKGGIPLKETLLRLEKTGHL